ncbi:hypothetical protein H6G74_17855 [Nostoc spongiaeforme FACHB-130]|uniref:Uncharacterized protein n=1 Tax=Nostoc spongiaeforme FACHB-130 TaxID=1357510 RepID=A0ABR8FXS1_9NOSO|nr:hypothetical protein [Nostoc spongiaeforme]MBD2596176.1 hypothetical protein [Nostoc spongiaeforme FACHB-130]
MSAHLEDKSSELFIDLSEKEQEPIKGGFSYPGLSLYNMFFQRTEIASFANINSTYSDGIRSFSSQQQTGYRLSQVTFGLSGGEFGGGRRGRKARRRRQYLLNMLFELMSMFG